MSLSRRGIGIGLGVLCAATALAAPALQAQDRGGVVRPVAKRSSATMSGGLGTFTPAAADPKLAAIMARSGLPDTGFRFTPSVVRTGSQRAVTVAVRARSNRTGGTDQAAIATAQPASLSLAPIAYNLGVSVGWKRFAVSGDLTRVDIATQPGSRDRADLGISYAGKRAGGSVRASSDKPLANTPVLIGDLPSYSIDMGGSYSLTRNLAVTAGVRYKSEQQRLPRVTDDRRDSQAVYVGTAFRF